MFVRSGHFFVLDNIGIRCKLSARNIQKTRFLQCKPGYAGNGEKCGLDSDNDGLPDSGLSCTDWGCLKVRCSPIVSKHYILAQTANATNKRQKDCLWKQRTHHRSENGSLGFIETFHKQ